MKPSINTSIYYGSQLSTPCGHGLWCFRFISAQGSVEEFYSKSCYYKEAITWATKYAKTISAHTIVVLP